MQSIGLQRSPKASKLIDQIVSADESLDACAFVEVLTADATFRLGGAPQVIGTAAILAFVEQLFARLSGLRHEIHASWESDGVLVYEAEVHYTFRDGTAVTIPYANILRLSGSLVSDYRVYLDTAALQERAAS